MVKLRLTRMGRHKRAYYRIVATDARTKVNGGYIELLGNYDPISGEIKLFDDIILNWLSKGAQPSETVKNILKDKGVWAKFVETKATKKPKASGTKKSSASAKPAAKKTATKAKTK
ncbi:MAG: 30S ribosomal protein S16 [Mycoplasma sp.]